MDEASRPDGPDDTKPRAPRVGRVYVEEARRDLWDDLKDAMIDAVRGNSPHSRSVKHRGIRAASGLLNCLVAAGYHIAQSSPDDALHLAKLGEDAMEDPARIDSPVLAAQLIDFIRSEMESGTGPIHGAQSSDEAE